MFYRSTRFGNALKRRAKPLSVALCSVLLAACSATFYQQLLSSYSDQLSWSRSLVAQGQASKAAAAFKAGDSGTAKYLRLLEQGRLEYLSPDSEQSLASFSQVDQQLRWLSTQPNYRVSSGLQQTASLISNDNFIEYTIPPYEQAMLHYYQAQNYLEQQGLSGALVEVRRANWLQQQALSEAPRDLEQELREYRTQYQAVLGEYPQSGLSSTLSDPYQLASSHALAGAMFVAAGEPNDAYISYRKALSLAPDNPDLKAEVGRLGKRLGMSDVEQYSGGAELELGEGQGLVVLIAEQGLVQARQEVKFTVPIPDGRHWRYYSVALPVMTGVRSADNLAFQLGDKHYVAAPMTNFSAVAQRQLQEDLPGLILRQVLRLATKDGLTREAEKSTKEDELAGALMNIYNIVSERADTRHWQTLPAQDNIAIKAVDSGSHRFSVPGWMNSESTINVSAGRVTLVFAGEYTVTRSFQL